MKLPIYYRNYLYSEEEKEKLWIEKLNKNERYILGRKIDVSQTYERYLRGIEEARIKNRELGYGKGWQDYEQRVYENLMRKMKQKERLTPSAGGFQKDLDIMKN